MFVVATEIFAVHFVPKGCVTRRPAVLRRGANINKWVEKILHKVNFCLWESAASPCTTPTGSGWGVHSDHTWQADQPWESILDEKSGTVYKSFKFQPFAALLELCSFSPQCVFCAPSKRKRQRKLCYTLGNQKVFSPVCVYAPSKQKRQRKLCYTPGNQKVFSPVCVLCSFKTKEAKKVVLHTRQSKGFLPIVCFMLLQNEKSKESCVTHSAIKSLSPQCVFCAHSKRKKAAFSSFASLILPKRKVNFARPKTRFYFR